MEKLEEEEHIAHVSLPPSNCSHHLNESFLGAGLFLLKLKQLTSLNISHFLSFLLLCYFL